jgi:hypothetical protein
MLPSQTIEKAIRRQGLDDGYHGRPNKPPFRSPPFLEAYLAGFQLGHDQRHLEIQEGTHPSLFEGKPSKFARRSA